ncbi:MAG TPA: hypothetical protein VHR72_15455 [Gemmataceae bacterium]|jgi:hypothetical protein|nr:hypothetical protein [Gemmataceae bacterium]
MPRGEWDDNTWYDDGDFPPASKNEGRSGMVAAAVFSFLMSAVNAISASCFLFCSGFWALVAVQNQGVIPLPADMLQLYMGFCFVVGAISGISFFVQLFAGISLLRGRRWARTATFWLAGYSVLLAAGLIALVVGIFVNGGNEESQPFSIAWMVLALLHGTYAIVEFSLLLQPTVARRYR